MRQKVELDYYQRLKIPEFSSHEEIRSARRKLALKYHPDRGGNLKTMQRINEAFDVLMKHKEAYDKLLQHTRQPQVFVFTYTYQWNVNTANTNSGSTWYF